MTSDDQLAAWRDAATRGGLPMPGSKRWQPLRAGVVNLWEFDTAEYWFVDGRAQFVGANQSGKSTLMALTTLILLSGDLSRRNVDTFSEANKSFRYYLEPTDNPNDRRDSDKTVNRGWAWVEYGRTDADQPQFFTTLLFAQSRRAQTSLTPTWAICAGQARVRAGLSLVAGQAVTTPGELREVVGFSEQPSGAAYAAAVSSSLFGFESADRLATVNRMLAVLRTPHLGQQLDPEWFTQQMRKALPALAQDEIDGLAEGWEQLDKLAGERDAAMAARDAVAQYERTAWRPWADAVLRRAADDVVAATTQLDNVTRTVRTATDAKKDATERLGQLEAVREQLLHERERAEVAYEEQLHSQAYRNAVDATRNAQHLRQKARADAETATARRTEAEQAERQAEEAAADLEAREQDVRARIGERANAVSAVAGAAKRAGLSSEATEWADADDIDRLNVAIEQRHGHVRRTRELLAQARAALAEEENRAAFLRAAETEAQRRLTEADELDHALGAAVQQLSDDLERWAQAAGQRAPEIALREAWLDAVNTEITLDKPRHVLRQLATQQWFEPRSEPLQRASALARDESARHRAEAAELDADADRRLDEQDPLPDTPTLWTRRERPEPSERGAPLWRLLDPRPTTNADDLAIVEAFLAASGLLDTWVSPDGVWTAERDGDDVLAAIATGYEPATGAKRLSTLLQLAGDGELARSARKVLDAVLVVDAGADLHAAVVFSMDGRWRTPTATGRVAPAEHGATLLGAAARAAERDRQVALLRQRATDARTAAAQRDADALIAETEQVELTRLREAGPSDAEVAHAAMAAQNAAAEHDRAERARVDSQAALQEAESASANANATLIDYAATHWLPTDDKLDEVADALRAATATIEQLARARLALDSALRERSGSSRRCDELGRHAHARRNEAEHTQRVAASAAARADTAEAALGADEQNMLALEEQLKSEKNRAGKAVEATVDLLQAQHGLVATAQAALQNADAARTVAEANRDASVTRWWRPVDSGLSAARGIDIAGKRTTTQALSQSQLVRRTVLPDHWPDTADDRQRRVETAHSRMAGAALTALRATLEGNGGRTAALTEIDEFHPFPRVLVLLDTSGEQVDVPTSIRRLTDQADRLATLHDEKMQTVLHELLQSTFIEHLRDRLLAVIQLLTAVNNVLEAHPTGADRTTIRLRRIAADGQVAGYDVLSALERGFVDSPEVQRRVRAFLERQIRQAQDAATLSGEDWTEQLSELLDYRAWFDVVAESRIGASGEYRPLTRKTHSVDSGGGKVITLLQPLLATLVALYQESELAPRLVWLDEAFEGVDLANRSAMLSLFVEFEMDFLLAGPNTLINSAQVPAAALWFISRAPAPVAGVDLSVMLWTGDTLELVQLAAPTWQ